MSLIDNCMCGRLNRLEYNLAYDILDRLCYNQKLSRADLILICNSLRRYASKYIHEHYKAAECKRVYNFILNVVHNHE